MAGELTTETLRAIRERLRAMPQPSELTFVLRVGTREWPDDHCCIVAGGEVCCQRHYDELGALAG